MSAKSKKQQVNPLTDCHLLFSSSTSLKKHNGEEQCIETAILYYLRLLMRQIIVGALLNKLTVGLCLNVCLHTLSWARITVKK